MAQIILDSNNNLIQGDFDNATLNNRTKLQTTTTNATTNVYVVPNGSSTSAGVSVANNSSLTNASKIVMATNGTTDTQIISGVNGSGTYLPLNFYTNNALSMTIDTANNVGIGTASPSGVGKFAVVQSAQSTTAYFANSNASWASDVVNSYSPSGTETSQISLSARSDGTSWLTSAYGAVLFRTGTAGSATERMRIDSSGILLLAGTSAIAGYQFTMYHTDTGGMAYKYNGTSQQNSCSFQNGNGQVGRIYTSGTATTYATSSDYRLKENVVPMTGALNKVALLNPVTFTWKTDGTNGQGFIAHELQAVVPDCVGGEKDAVDAEGKPVYQDIDTSFLVATLTAAIKEQQTIINELKTRIEALENK
jgi:hypothetical protein